jgi:hypothetical protein
MDQTEAGRVVGRDRGSWALACSAVVLSAAIVWVGGRGSVAPASADVATIGSQTITNLRSGTNEDVIAILDGREERLFVYQVQNMKDLKLVSTDDLRDIFAKAKAASSGTR